MMMAHKILLLAYLAAVIAFALADTSGNGNGNYNTGNDNGFSNGNLNTGTYNGNGNGNYNQGNNNGFANGNLNVGTYNGNHNGNGNIGGLNGVGNGNGNSASNNGNGNGNGNIGSGNGNGNGNGNAKGQGDPIMTGFGGRAFEFMGQPGTMYSLLSEKFHKINTGLKLGVMWDHNGTYMESFGFQYRDQQIQIGLTAENDLAVMMNGEPLVMTKGETELELIPFVQGGELMVLWQKHREGLGNAIEISTNMMQLLVWVTPAGTVDDGGVEQPAYLNFDIALLGPPFGNQMEGIVGETYNRMLVGDAVNDPNSKYFLPNDYTFHGKEIAESYIVDGLFGETAHNAFNQEHKRILIEDTTTLQFPMRALGRAAGLNVGPKTVVLRANGGRKGRFL